MFSSKNRRAFRRYETAGLSGEGACLWRGLPALDEPFTGLDGENRKKAADCIRKYANGRMVLISTHDGEDAYLLDGETVKLEN